MYLCNQKLIVIVAVLGRNCPIGRKRKFSPRSSLIQQVSSSRVNVIDLYNESGINGSTITSYTVDRLHPNAAGMDLITKVVVEKVKAKLESK